MDIELLLPDSMPLLMLQEYTMLLLPDFLMHQGCPMELLDLHTEDMEDIEPLMLPELMLLPLYMDMDGNLSTKILVELHRFVRCRPCYPRLTQYQATSRQKCHCLR